MADLHWERCFNHADREAAARCLECGRHFCRECITEHEGRVLCSLCLSQKLQPRAARQVRLGPFIRFFQGAAGLWLAWLFFYYMARILLDLPSDFHEGSIWKDLW